MDTSIENPNTTPIKEVALPKSAFTQSFLDFFTEVGQLSRFTGRFFKEVVTQPYEFGELIKQCFIVGYQSFPLVGMQ